MNPSVSAVQRPWYWSWFGYITVEPTMFLYMFAFQLTSVVEQDLFVRKACLVNHNLTEEICDNLKNYTDTFYKEVQVCSIIVSITSFVATKKNSSMKIPDYCVNVSSMESYCWLCFCHYNCSFHWLMVG